MCDIENIDVVNAFEAQILVNMAFIAWLAQSFLRAVGWSGVWTWTSFSLLIPFPCGLYAFLIDSRNAQYFQERNAIHYALKIFFNWMCMMVTIGIFLLTVIDTTKEDLENFNPLGPARTVFTDGELKNSTAHIGDFILMQASVNLCFSSYFRIAMNLGAILSIYMKKWWIGHQKFKKPLITNPNDVIVVITSDVNKNVGTRRSKI